MANGAPFIAGLKQYRVDVAGHGTQQAGLSSLVGARRQERLHFKARAQLALQEDLVEVSIRGHQVGHLSPTATQAFHRIVRYGQRSPHETFECAALIHGTADQLSVRLDLPLDD